MYFFLILFFISLFGIILMIGRKLLLLPNNTSNKKIESILTSEFFSLENIKDVTIKNLKKYGFVILVITLRISIKSSHLIKKGYKGTKNKMIKMVNVYLFGKRNEEKEKKISNFLKKVSDYKYRIREIKHRIKEEEGME